MLHPYKQILLVSSGFPQAPVCSEQACVSSLPQTTSPSISLEYFSTTTTGIPFCPATHLLSPWLTDPPMALGAYLPHYHTQPCRQALLLPVFYSLLSPKTLLIPLYPWPGMAAFSPLPRNITWAAEWVKPNGTSAGCCQVSASSFHLLLVPFLPFSLQNISFSHHSLIPISHSLSILHLQPNPHISSLSLLQGGQNAACEPHEAHQAILSSSWGP